MKDKLRELAVSLSKECGESDKDSRIRVATVRFFIKKMLAILDAEGDGGAIAVVRRLMTPEGLPYGDWDSLCKSPLPEEMARDGWSYQVAYLHPARSGVVSDEDVEGAWMVLTGRAGSIAHEKDHECMMDIERKAMRAPLEHFAAIAQEKQS